MKASLGGTIQRNLSKCTATQSKFARRPQQYVQVRNFPWVPLAYRKGVARSAKAGTAPIARSRAAPRSRPSPRSKSLPSRRIRKGASSHRDMMDPSTASTNTAGELNQDNWSLSFAIQSQKESLLGMQKELDTTIIRYREALGAGSSTSSDSKKEALMDSGVSSHQIASLLSKLSGLHTSCKPDSWKHVEDTENGFREVGKLVSDMIGLSARIQYLVLKEMAQQGDKQDEHVLYFYCSLAEQLLLTLIEMQADRLAFVEAALALEGGGTGDGGKGVGWFGWLKSKFMDNSQEKPPEEDSKGSSKAPMAHEDALCVPRLEHFQSVVNLVVLTLRQELKDPHQSPFRKIRRAQRLQQLLEKTPPNVEPDVKTVRGLLNCYALIGSYESARSCEKVADKYLDLRDELFGAVLHAYFMAAKSSPRNQERSKAAVRADELVRLKWMDESGYEEKKFVHCTKAILCLNAVGGEAIPDVCKRAEILVNTCVGKENLEEIFRNDSLEGLWKIAPSLLTLPLLNCLVLVYAASRDASRVNLSKRLLQIMLEDSDFKENVENPYPDVRTCKAVLAGLVGINDRRNRWTRIASPDDRATKHSKDSSPENLEYGIQLLNSMFARPQCWPDQSYFHSLLRLLLMAKPQGTGNTADALLSKMHIRECFGDRAGGSWKVVTRKTYNYVLRAWLASAEGGDANAAKRALDILEMMEAQSIPLFVSADHANSNGSATYNSSTMPDRSTYQLLLKICGSVRVPEEKEAALDIALVVDKKMRRRGINPTSDSFSLMFACCTNLLPENSKRRQNVTQQLLEDARKQGNVNMAVLERARGIKHEGKDEERPADDGPGTTKSSGTGGGAGLLSDLL